jgi:competence CoiA-like predicted nuclease
MILSRHYGKSLAHQQIQHHLKSLIPSLELEKRLGNRIADAAWEQRKIVFEVQYSPISLEEAKDRTKAYKSLGYTVVWLLHDREFNQPKPSPGEIYLRKRAISYFTDGHQFYDQYGSFRTPIDLTLPLRKKSQIRHRLKIVYQFLIYRLLENTTL